jgi:uncharacterized membrane protein
VQNCCMKKTKFLFDLPVTKDWLFWVFIVIAALNGISAFSGVVHGSGVSTSSFSLLSGTIDGLFVLLSAYIWIIPIYFVRRLIRKSKSKTEK